MNKNKIEKYLVSSGTLRVFMVGFISLVMFSAIWGYFSFADVKMQTNLFALEQPSELEILPNKAALLPGEEQEFKVIGKFSYGEKQVPVSWRIVPEDFGELECNTESAISCRFSAQDTDVSQVGKIIVSFNDQISYSKIKITPEDGGFSLYSDVSPTDWYFSSLYYLAKLPSAMKAFSGKNFNGDAPLSRAEWVSALDGALTEKGLYKTERQKRICRQVFSDVSFEDDLSDALCRFHAYGWISGILKDGKRYFNPQKPVSREEASKIICSALCDKFQRAHELMNREYENFYFADIDNNIFATDVISLSLYGMFQNNDLNQLSQSKYLSRAEGVVFLQRALSFFDEKYIDEDKNERELIAGLGRQKDKFEESDLPVLLELTPSLGDGSENIVFEAEYAPERSRMIAFYYQFGSEFEKKKLGAGTVGIKEIIPTGRNKQEIVLEAFQPPDEADLIEFHYFINGLMSNSLNYQIVDQNEPKILEFLPTKGAEIEKFSIVGKDLQKNNRLILLGAVFRTDEKTGQIELVKTFEQSETELWSNEEIWFSKLSVDELKSGDFVRFRIADFAQDSNEISVKSNIVEYIVDLESKPIIYSISKEVFNPEESLEIFGRNFGQSPEQDFSKHLSYTCMQKNLANFLPLESGEVTIEKFAVWEDGYIMLNDLLGICTNLTVGDIIRLNIADDQISNDVDLTLYNKSIPNPVIDMISPAEGDGNHEIILSGRYFGNQGDLKVSYYYPETDEFVGGGSVEYSYWGNDTIILPRLNLEGSEAHIYIVTRSLRSNQVIYKVK